MNKSQFSLVKESNACLVMVKEQLHDLNFDIFRYTASKILSVALLCIRIFDAVYQKISLLKSRTYSLTITV